jgi:hypothetical protein
MPVVLYACSGLPNVTDAYPTDGDNG